MSKLLTASIPNNSFHVIYVKSNNHILCFNDLVMIRDFTNKLSEDIVKEEKTITEYAESLGLTVCFEHYPMIESEQQHLMLLEAEHELDNDMASEWSRLINRKIYAYGEKNAVFFVSDKIKIRRIRKDLAWLI